MARKSKGQQEAQAKVEERLTSDVPLRLDAEAVQSGGERGSKRVITGIHPSLEGATQEMASAGLQSGTVTTPSGLSVSVSRSKNQGGPYRPQAPEFGNPKASPAQEGVSQRYETPIGREHGRSKAAELTAEADALARRPNPLRSDGLVDNMVGMFAPSVGGNQRGLGGRLSAQAKSSDQPLGEHHALKSLGYSDAVQTQMLTSARDRIARQQQNRPRNVPELSDTEVSSRAYGQVTEHLDEALHGTKAGRVSESESSVIHDLASDEGGYAVMRNSPAEGAGQPINRNQGPAPTGPGMSKRRSPQQRAMREGVKALVRQKGGWSAATGSAVTAAAEQDLKVLDLRQKARRAGAVPPEERNTMSPGADPELKARRHAQPVFSTGKAAPYASSAPVGVGVPSESKKTPLPAKAREGAVSPTPSNLPTEPVRLGRTREERGQTRSPAGGYVQAPRDYGSAISDYAASRPQGLSKGATARAERESSRKAKLSANQGNVQVAQTKGP